MAVSIGAATVIVTVPQWIERAAFWIKKLVNRGGPANGRRVETCSASLVRMRIQPAVKVDIPRSQGHPSQQNNANKQMDESRFGVPYRFLHSLTEQNAASARPNRCKVLRPERLPSSLKSIMFAKDETIFPVTNIDALHRSTRSANSADNSTALPGKQAGDGGPPSSRRPGTNRAPNSISAELY